MRLDLSIATDVDAAVLKVIRKAVPVGAVKSIKRNFAGDLHSDSLSYLIDSSITAGLVLDNGEWCQRLETEFLKYFDSIRAFHACRAFAGISVYKREGIFRLTRSRLSQLAHFTFGDYVESDRIDEVVENQELQDGGDSIYLFTDTSNPLKRGGGHYLQSGSETLQGISAELGLSGRGILASQGSAYFIECEIPILDISSDFRSELWSILVTNYFRREVSDEYEEHPIDFCIRLVSDVAPEQILDFHLVESQDAKAISPRH